MIYVLSLAAFLAISWVDAQSICPDLYRRFSKDHTYCLPPSSTCNLKQQGVTAEDKELILSRHNELRSKVAMGKEPGLPPASDMLQMVWDEEMATVAQKLANQCQTRHDCGECRQTANFETGQNVAGVWISSDEGPLPTNDWGGIVEFWYKDVADLKPTSVDSFSGEGRGFAQIAWAKTWKVGCGYAVYRGDGSTNILYVCNYGPSGAYHGKPIYTSGPPYTNCPVNSCQCAECANTPRYEGLCQIGECGRPKYRRAPGFTFFCDFEDDNADCARQTSGADKWKATTALSGPFIGIVLNGGENSVLNFTKRMIAHEERSCLVITYRMGPNVDGEETAGKLEAILVDSTGYRANYALYPSRFFAFPYTTDVSWKSEFRVSFTFEVPQGAPEQYFELGELTLGQCK